MGILLGLLAAFAWGLADFCARFAARQIGNFRTLLYMQLIGLSGLSLWLWLIEGTGRWEWSLIGLAGLLAVGNTFAGLALYRSFEIGLLSIVSPIAASYGAITLALGILSGQKLALLELIGLIITIAGVVLASGDFSALGKAGTKKRSAGIGMALIAAGCFGVVFWGLGYVTPQLGGVLPTWVMRVVGPVVVLSLAGSLRRDIGGPTGPAWPWVIGVGLLDTAAFLFYNFGLQGADSGIVAVISSLFSAVTVLLAAIFLREKLALNQWAGIGGILIGIALVSTG